MTQFSDPKTEQYFNNHIPEYHTARVEHVVEAINKYGKPGASLLDLGCGVGNTLDYLKTETRLGDIAGLDVSQQCCKITRERLSCPVICASVTDRKALEPFAGQFDFVLLAAVLHHLIGSTRTASRAAAAAAVENAMTVLKPDGYLIVVEPIFSPQPLVTGVFYLKQALSQISSKRIELGDKWNNIGAPVVSYFDNPGLVALLYDGGAPVLVERWVDPALLPRGARLLFNKTDTTIIAKA